MSEKKVESLKLILTKFDEGKLTKDETVTLICAVVEGETNYTYTPYVPNNMWEYHKDQYTDQLYPDIKFTTTAK